jgi:hypothetical protein
MSLTFQQIMITAYNSYFVLGQFSLVNNNDGNGVVIGSWNVPGVAQPTVEQVMALDNPTLELQYNVMQFSLSGGLLLTSFMDSVALQRQYSSAVSCASYINSGTTQWKNEATAFIAWRDSVFTYIFEQEALMLAGTRTIPTFADFQTELPVITWPS